jgi:hypothetical protein
MNLREQPSKLTLKRKNDDRISSDEKRLKENTPGSSKSISIKDINTPYLRNKKNKLIKEGQVLGSIYLNEFTSTDWQSIDDDREMTLNAAKIVLNYVSRRRRRANRYKDAWHEDHIGAILFDGVNEGTITELENRHYGIHERRGTVYGFAMQTKRERSYPGTKENPR